MQIAIIGFGERIAHVYNGFAKAAGGRIALAGWADAMPEPYGRQFVTATGRGFADHRRMLAELRPDAVMIGSPNHLHLEHIRDALRAGCRVFCEKPVVISPEESWEVAQLLREYGQERFLVGLVLRCSWVYRKAIAVIASGELGVPVSMEANEHLIPEHGGFITRNWRRHDRYSGGHLLEKCCHDIDLLQSLLGGRIRRVASFGGRNVYLPANAHFDDDPAKRYSAWRGGWEGTKESPFTVDGDVVDNQVLAAEMESGARLTFHANNHSTPQRRWRLCCTRGVWESDFSTGRIRTQDAFGPPRDEAIANSAGHYGSDGTMAQDLAAAWLEGTPFPVPTRAAIEAGLAAMGAERARHEGRVFDLSPWWERLDAILKPEPRRLVAEVRS